MRRRALLCAAAGLLVLAACDTRSPTTAPAGAAGQALATETHDTQPISDAALAQRVREVLSGDDTTNGAEIQVSVIQGRARLSGFVDTAAVRLRAGVVAGEVEGIVAVDNRLIQRHQAEVFADPIGDARVHL